MKILETQHGKLETPFFMPDATRGFVKFLSSKDLEEVEVPALVVNTYHLLLRPEINFFQNKKIHDWINWNKSILSDSGGYQVFSLIHKNPKMGKIYEKGAYFRSPLDGNWQWLTPEKSIQIQFDLGVDMMVVLDDPPPNNYSKDKIRQSIKRTLKWARRSLKEYKRQIRKRKLKFDKRPLLFCVVQGGPYIDLREYCVSELKKIANQERDNYFSDWDGYGFGGRHINERGILLKDVLTATSEAIPDSAFKFALGIGKPEDILESVAMGWEIFDCVIPTREGRHGKLFLKKSSHIINNGKLEYQTINILNRRYEKDNSRIDNFSSCELCKNYTFSFLHYLFQYKDPSGMRLAALNNLKFYLDLFLELKNLK